MSVLARSKQAFGGTDYTTTITVTGSAQDIALPDEVATILVYGDSASVATITASAASRGRILWIIGADKPTSGSNACSVTFTNATIADPYAGASPNKLRVGTADFVMGPRDTLCLWLSQDGYWVALSARDN